MVRDRSLIPGLGAGLSLLAAIGYAFFLTAALLAFHSWPRGATTGEARALIVAADGRPVRAILVSPVARSPHQIAAATRASVPADRHPIGARIIPSHRRGTLVVTASNPPDAPLASSPRPAVAPTPAPAPTPSAPDLAAAAQGTTKSVAALVTGATGGLATTVAPISPLLAGTVANLGVTASGTVSTIGSRLADVLRGFAAAR